MNNWILLDVNFLAYRALYSTGPLQFQDNPTGVIFGVLSEALRTMERFQSRSVCWCFDYGKPLRLQRLSTYKGSRHAKRKDMDDDERRMHREMRSQIKDIVQYVLPQAGFRNICYSKGYEADDVIASLVSKVTTNGDYAVIVSSDEDLYQLLGDQCLVYSPHKKQVINEKKFIEMYGITPSLWPTVKALAGCSSDDIPGLVGVGEKTAIKFLKGQIKAGTKTASKFDKASEIIERNLPLVSLPYAGCPRFKLKSDQVTQEKWDAVMEEYGFHSLSRQAPVGPSLFHG